MSIEISPVVKTISLDFARKTAPIMVFAKQGDNLSRIINITPTINGIPVVLLRDNYISYFAAKKPDGTYIYNESAEITEDGAITVTLSDQSLAAHGNATCCIVLKNAETGEVLTSQNFIVNIEFSAGAYENLASSDEILGLDGKIEEVNQLIEDIESMLGEGVFNSKSIPHMRFSAYADGTGFTETWSAGMNYIGFAIAETAPAQKEEYIWAQFASNVRDTVRITLKADAWENNMQTVDCESILEKSSAWSSYAPDYKIEYINYGISINSASVGKATFECVTVPAVDVDVMLTITDPMVAAGSADVPDGEQPTSSKYVMRDSAGNLSAVNVEYPAYPNLIYRYEHTSNKEVHPTAVDLATGVFTSQAHGLTSGWQVLVAVNAPHHLLRPYDYLPGGLRIGPDNGTGAWGQTYYVNVVDENTFTLSTTSGGAAVTFTEVSTMDLSKFHFERNENKGFTFGNLPPSRELLVVIKGRMLRSYRYLWTNNTSRMIGDKSFDSDNYSDGYGSTRLGSIGGWGSLYATIEIKYIGEKHMIMISEQETTAFKPDNTPVPGHVRKFIHYYTVDDFINAISMHTDGMLANGTTVEVYAK